MDADLHAELRAYIVDAIATGLRSKDDIVQSAIELHDNVDAATAEAIYDCEAAAHAARQADWPEITDCDRLDAAFDELNAHGIMARHDWTCCQTCGHGEMHDEYNRVLAQNPTPLVRGYAFYHQQDTEGAVARSGLCLAYGAVEPGEDRALAIARKIVTVLESHGLRVDWDGSLRKRIEIRLTWQRRSPPERWL